MLYSATYKLFDCMQNSEITPLILSHQTFFQNPLDLVPRMSFSPYLEANEIIFISGPLYAGKTSLLRQIASNLQGSKIYIDFGDSKIQELGSESFQVIEEIATEIHGRKSSRNEAGHIYYFLDEIYNVPGWEIWVDGLNRQGAKIFITSSCSRLKEQEFSMRFKSRNKIIRLFPFSFKEYILLRDAIIPGSKFLTPSKSDEILCMFLQYFENGGFPAVIKNNDFQLCQKYFEGILQKEAAKGCDSKVVSGLKRLSIFLISNTASECLLETLKKVSGIENKEIICKYLDFLENNFLLYRIPKLTPLSESSSEMDVQCKVYASDTGFFKAVCPNYPDNLGLRFENLVYLELLRQGKQMFYSKNMNECDFLIKEKDSENISAAIQTSIHLGSPAVRERAVLGLMEAMIDYGLEEGLILTMDEEEVLFIEGKDEKKKIIVKSVWKWMLE
jgi:uncharacterized protein